MWEEWVNDLDKRQIIQELLQDVPEARVIGPERKACSPWRG